MALSECLTTATSMRSAPRPCVACRKVAKCAVRSMPGFHGLLAMYAVAAEARVAQCRFTLADHVEGAGT